MAVITLSAHLDSPRTTRHNQTKACLKRSHPRRVKFNEAMNTCFDNDRWWKEECKISWYSKVEYKQIKMERAALARSISRKELRVNSAEDSYRNVLLRTHILCRDMPADHVQIPDKEWALLRRTTKKWLSRLGLERASISTLGAETTKRRAQVVQRVLGAQANVNDTEDSTQDQLEVLKLVSESVSRVSCLFARHMALAGACP